MPYPPTPDRACKVAGCGAWSVRGQVYCKIHLQQWQDNLRVGAADPTPRLMGPGPRLCRARGCRLQALAHSRYCLTHAQRLETDATIAEAITQQFAELVARLDVAAPDCLATLQREMDLLTMARKILVAHAEIASRSGWQGISPMTFVRLWLSSATTVTELTKARFVMENATGADFDRLLGGVYSRIERSVPPEQQPLPGLLEQAAGVGTGCVDARCVSTSVGETVVEADATDAGEEGRRVRALTPAWVHATPLPHGDCCMDAEPSTI